MLSYTYETITKKFLMTPTNVCNAMNQVYEQLKQMSIVELETLKQSLLVNHKMTQSENILLEYQIEFTIYRKKIGRW